ncbi:MAG: hypothetical protein CBC16_00745 [Verrucomicrobia bacterium TMED56]|nr:hypothetical protein [SAR116 cluster bacterium]OUU45739.1 MAG: hypothetical protein CBC16_00745 [Verrucomicrobia bacterium TMED56]RPH10758.1 MAG: cysteine hydrolase [Alphaproteobacteria bacterium TMED54]|tara:strand:- start:2209 stop:2895 length:687 start_codon:yes stop_codon:yes gene_type:complete
MTADFTNYKSLMNKLLKIKQKETCLLTVDMQNEYLDTKNGTSPLSNQNIDRILENSNFLLNKLRILNIPIVHCYVVRKKEELKYNFSISPYIDVSQKNKLSQNKQAKARKKPERVEGTISCELPKILVDENDIHITSKRNFDCFQDTELDMLLKRTLNIKNIIICGVNTDTCVYGTTFGASNRGYNPIVIECCTGSMRGDEQHEVALKIMSQSIAWVMKKEEILNKLN